MFLTEIGQRYPHPHDNIVRVVNSAGWHRSSGFRLPENRRLLFLPPYSAELNPQELI